MQSLEAMGVDSIITDFPTSTRMFFDNRAQNRLRLAPSASRDSSAV
jgi:glycerophosphoryl diester phosphodiesterase